MTDHRRLKQNGPVAEYIRGKSFQISSNQNPTFNTERLFSVQGRDQEVRRAHRWESTHLSPPTSEVRRQGMVPSILCTHLLHLCEPLTLILVLPLLLSWWVCICRGKAPVAAVCHGQGYFPPQNCTLRHSASPKRDWLELKGTGCNYSVFLAKASRPSPLFHARPKEQQLQEGFSAESTLSMSSALMGKWGQLHTPARALGFGNSLQGAIFAHSRKRKWNLSCGSVPVAKDDGGKHQTAVFLSLSRNSPFSQCPHRIIPSIYSLMVV